MAPEKASAHEVFTVFQNGGAWPSQGLSFFIGIIGSVFAMFGTSRFRAKTHTYLLTRLTGCDSAVHVGAQMTEKRTVLISS